MNEGGIYRVRGWHVLAGMIAFFGAVVAVNIAFAVVAIQSFPGEDVKQAYMRGLRYNDALSERRTQAELGWQVEAELRPTTQGASVEVTLSDAHGARIDGAAIAGTLRRPSDSRLDRAIAFIPRAGGIYAAEADGLALGRWQLRARATDPSGRVLDFDADLSWSTP
jgi:nitrogen fixation protein FixH